MRNRVLAALALVCAAAIVAVLVARRGATRQAAVGRDGGALPSPVAVPREPTRVFPPPPPEGDAVLAGRVVGNDGSGIADVTVTVERDVAFDSAAGRAAARDAGVPVPRSAFTDADGAFRIPGLARAMYRLRIEGPGVVAAELRRVVAPDEALNVAAARLVSIAGVVTDEGTRVEGATVEIGGVGLAEPVTVATGADGRFTVEALPEGTYALTAWRGARAAPVLSLGRFGPPPWPDVALALAPAALVGGRVLDAQTSLPVEGARLALIPEAAGGAPRTAESDVGGDFAIEGVAAGSWTLEADAPGYLPAKPYPVEATAGMNTAILVVLVRGGVVAGRVVDPSGVPIRGARVELGGELAGGKRTTISAVTRGRRLGRTGAASGPPSARLIPVGELGVLVGPIPYPPPPGATVAQASPDAPLVELPVAGFVTDDDGRFRIDAVPSGSYVVTASHPEFAAGEGTPVDLRRASDQTGVVVTLRRGVTLVGRVTDGGGIPILGAEVSARVDARLVATAFSDGDGRYSLPRLTGRVAVKAFSKGYGAAEVVLQIRPEDDGREAVQDFTLGAAGEVVSGVIFDHLRRGLPGATVQVRDGDALVARATTDAHGRFTLRGLTAGSHRVEVKHPEYAPLSVATTAPDDRFEVTLEPAGGIEGRVVDGHSGGPMLTFTIKARGPGGATVSSAFEKGDFALRSLAPGRWALTVEAPRYATRVVTVDVPAARDPGRPSVEDVRIELVQGAVAAGAVYDERGDPASGATVQCGLVRATTDRYGRFRLTGVEPGDVTIRVTHPTQGTGELPVALRSGDEVLTLEIRIAR